MRFGSYFTSSSAAPTGVPPVSATTEMLPAPPTGNTSEPGLISGGGPSWSMPISTSEPGTGTGVPGGAGVAGVVCGGVGSTGGKITGVGVDMGVAVGVGNVSQPAFTATKALFRVPGGIALFMLSTYAASDK